MTQIDQTRSGDGEPSAPPGAATPESPAATAQVIGEATAGQAEAAGQPLDAGSEAARAGSQAPPNGSQPSAPGQPSAPQSATTRGSDSESLLGAILGGGSAITVTAAFIYGAGALTLALRLGFTHLAWDSVIGQLPNVLIITTGFGEVILPAAVIGILGAILLSYIVNQNHHKQQHPHACRIQRKLRLYLRAKPSIGHFIAWLATALIIGAIEAAISQPVFYYYKYHYFQHPDIMIAGSEAFLVVTILSMIAVGLALIMLPAPLSDPELDAYDDQNLKSRASRPWWRFISLLGRRASGEDSDLTTRDLKPPSGLRPWRWKVLAGVLITLAAIPGVAAFSASELFPYALACWYSPGYGYLSGNLIGTNGGWAYMVEYNYSDYSHDFINVIPLSTVRLMSVGKFGGCDIYSL